jgi:hypothetical protein
LLVYINAFMTGFATKEITEKRSLSSDLRQAREAALLSLTQAAKRVKIKAEYLAALESADLEALPGKVYARSFLKRYAAFLQLDVVRAAGQFDAECARGLWGEQVERGPLEVVRQKHFRVTPHLLRNASLALVVLVLVGYLVAQIVSIVTPPELIVESPRDKMVTHEFSLEVRGRVLEEAKITLNNQELFTDETGVFTRDIGLRQGVNVITLVAKKRYSRPNQQVFTVVVTPENANDLQKDSQPL